MIFYYCDFWHTFSFHPNTTTLYLMIFCKDELRNGKKYAKLAYLLLISGNSGIQKHMACRAAGAVALMMARKHCCSFMCCGVNIALLPQVRQVEVVVLYLTLILGTKYQSCSSQGTKYEPKTFGIHTKFYSIYLGFWHKILTKITGISFLPGTTSQTTR